DYAASELTDTIAAIQSRQERCFRQLEASLNQRSLQNVLACSAWIANKPSTTSHKHMATRMAPIDEGGRAGGSLRFHDLRHPAITEPAESNASGQTIMSIAGHVSQK